MFTFQYPRTDRRDCNPIDSLAWSRSGSCFQYPRTDRRDCNKCKLRNTHGTRTAFSILARIEETATDQDLLGLAQGGELSVSSHGSKGLQPSVAQFRGVLDNTFSILARIEGTATGSQSRWSGAIWTFSILARIEGTATVGQYPAVMRAVHFQYPRTDRRDCNVTRRLVQRDVLAFQYPRTDRRDCNLCLRNDTAAEDNPFSILARIEGTATAVHYELEKYTYAFSILARIEGTATSSSSWTRRATRSFQYPRTDRRDCNRRRATDT